MASLQDELAALNIDSDADDAASLYTVCSDTQEQLLSSPHRAARSSNSTHSLATEMAHPSHEHLMTALRTEVRPPTQPNVLRLRTSLDTLRHPVSNGKRDTHSPNTLRKLLAEPSDYDGAGYGDPQDDSEPEESYPGLDEAMAALQGFCTSDQQPDCPETGHGSEEEESEAIGGFAKRLDTLRSQSAVEQAASRCIAAHETLAAAMPRTLTLLRDLSAQVPTGYLSVGVHAMALTEQDAQERGDLRDALCALSETVRAFHIPRRPGTGSSASSRHEDGGVLSGDEAVTQLGRLHSETSTLLRDLASLSDALSMLRQTSLHASRKLRAVREQVAQIQQEAQYAEQCRFLLQHGSLHQGMATRIVARQCREICGGFEGTLAVWRGRLAGV